MAAWRYEFSLLVMKNISLVCCAHSRNIFQHSKRNLFHISVRPTTGIQLSNSPHVYELYIVLMNNNNRKIESKFTCKIKLTYRTCMTVYRIYHLLLILYASIKSAVLSFCLKVLKFDMLLTS